MEEEGKQGGAEQPEAPNGRGARGREVNRRIAGGDLQRIVAQVKLVRRVYGVGALSTGILAGLLLSKLGDAQTEVVPLLLACLLLCALVCVQALGTLRLPWAPRSWSLGLAGLQSAFYLISILFSDSSSTQLIWVLLFWIAVSPMGRAQEFQSKHADLYAAQLLGTKTGQGSDRAPPTWGVQLLRVAAVVYGLALCIGALALL